MCIYMCVEVVLINVLASHLAPPNKNSWLRPWSHNNFNMLSKPKFDLGSQILFVFCQSHKPLYIIQPKQKITAPAIDPGHKFCCSTKIFLMPHVAWEDDNVANVTPMLINWLVNYYIQVRPSKLMLFTYSLRRRVRYIMAQVAQLNCRPIYVFVKYAT